MIDGEAPPIRLEKTKKDERKVINCLEWTESSPEEDRIGIDAWTTRGKSAAIRIRYTPGFCDLCLEPYTWNGVAWDWGRDARGKVHPDFVVLVPKLVSGQRSFILDGAPVFDYFEEVMRRMSGKNAKRSKKWFHMVMDSELKYKINLEAAEDQEKILLFIPEDVFHPWILGEFQYKEPDNGH